MSTINATMTGCLLGALVVTPAMLVALDGYDTGRAVAAALPVAAGVIGSWVSLAINMRGGVQ